MVAQQVAHLFAAGGGSQAHQQSAVVHMTGPLYHAGSLLSRGCWGCVHAQVVQLYKGAKLSANLPYKVEFAIPQEDGAKPVKLIAHLVRCCQLSDTAPVLHEGATIIVQGLPSCLYLFF